MCGSVECRIYAYAFVAKIEHTGRDSAFGPKSNTRTDPTITDCGAMKHLYLPESKVKVARQLISAKSCASSNQTSCTSTRKELQEKMGAAAVRRSSDETLRVVQVRVHGRTSFWCSFALEFLRSACAGQWCYVIALLLCMTSRM